LPIFRFNDKAFNVVRSVRALLNSRRGTTRSKYQGEPEQVLHHSAPCPPQTFDNREFWEKRYTTDLKLGSGAGSRGEFVEYKRRLLRQMIEEFYPRSILDVGCGDIEATKDLPFSGEYTGIDLSPSIVARNRTLRPAWNFIVGDFLDIIGRDQLKADLVICFDVLIHQHDDETYRDFVRELVNASREVVVINGFESLPRRGRVSRNTAYHEPITHTITKLGVGQMKIIEPFRNSLIVQINKRPARTELRKH
jgi:SAM-dependent methyltransferase